jgi:hypothetical protein
MDESLRRQLEKALRKIQAIIDYHKRENTRLLNEYIESNEPYFIGYDNEDDKRAAITQSFTAGKYFQISKERIHELYNYQMDLMGKLEGNKNKSYFA